MPDCLTGSSTSSRNAGIDDTAPRPRASSRIPRRGRARTLRPSRTSSPTPARHSHRRRRPSRARRRRAAGPDDGPDSCAAGRSNQEGGCPVTKSAQLSRVPPGRQGRGPRGCWSCRPPAAPLLTARRSGAVLRRSRDRESPGQPAERSTSSATTVGWRGATITRTVARSGRAASPPSAADWGSRRDRCNRRSPVTSRSSRSRSWSVIPSHAIGERRVVRRRSTASVGASLAVSFRLLPPARVSAAYIDLCQLIT